MSEQTGGRHLPADANELPDIAAKIGVELRNRYVLGYTPTNQARDGRYHTLQVKVVPPKGLGVPDAAPFLPPRLLRAFAIGGDVAAPSRLELSFDRGVYLGGG